MLWYSDATQLNMLVNFSACVKKNVSSPHYESTWSTINSPFRLRRWCHVAEFGDAVCVSWSTECLRSLYHAVALPWHSKQCSLSWHQIAQIKTKLPRRFSKHCCVSLIMTQQNINPPPLRCLCCSQAVLTDLIQNIRHLDWIFLCLLEVYEQETVKNISNPHFW